MIFSPALEHLSYSNTSMFRGINPLTKLLLAAVYLILNLRFGGTSFICFFLFVVTVFLFAKLRFSVVKRPVMIAISIAAFLAAAKLHFTKTGPAASLLIDFYPGALEVSVIAGLRVVSGFLIVISFVGTTPLNEVMSALHKLKVPAIFIETFMIIYKYVFVFNDEGIRIKNAQAVRMGYSGLRSSLESLGNLAGILLMRAVNRSSGMVDALNVRGYNGSIFFPTGISPLGFADYVLLVLFGVLPLVLSFAGLL